MCYVLCFTQHPTLNTQHRTARCLRHPSILSWLLKYNIIALAVYITGSYQGLQLSYQALVRIFQALVWIFQALVWGYQITSPAKLITCERIRGYTHIAWQRMFYVECVMCCVLRYACITPFKFRLSSADYERVASCVLCVTLWEDMVPRRGTLASNPWLRERSDRSLG